MSPALDEALVRLVHALTILAELAMGLPIPMAVYFVIRTWRKQ